MARIIDPSDVARAFRQEVRARVAALGRPLKLVGLLSAEAAQPSKTYASYTKAGCDDVGIAFDLRSVPRLQMEEAVDQANEDPNVHGIIAYYPIFGTEQDRYLQDQVVLTKDIEGLNSFWARKLYHNQRFVDAEKKLKAILPCTPLAIVKLLEVALSAEKPGRDWLAGRTITVFNRSEVVGRPLASMLANDGADVYSFDVNGPLLFKRDCVVETDATRAEALARSSVVITGVPSRDFPLVQPHEIRAGTACINFSTLKNFAPGIEEKASVVIPRVGPMTVAMALRNTLRLYDNYHA